MPKLFELVPLPKPPRISGNTFKTWLGNHSKNIPLLPGKVFDPTVEVGIEVEVENIGGNIPLSTGFWQMKGDNSLRNNGAEFVSIAVKGDQLHWALSELHWVLPQTAVYSQRTSVHVHMDMQGMTPEQIASITLVYLTVEKVLYRWVGHDRDKNIFCFPLHELPLVDTLFSRLENVATKGNVQGSETRYSGLNFTPLTTFGTLEFRQMHGTGDMGRVLTWVNLLQRIRAYALSKSKDQLIAELLQLNTNSMYGYYMAQVFGDMLPELATPTLDGDVAFGVLSVKRALLSNRWKGTLLKSSHADSAMQEWVVLQSGKPVAGQYAQYNWVDVLGAALRPDQADLVRTEAQPPARARRDPFIQFDELRVQAHPNEEEV